METKLPQKERRRHHRFKVSNINGVVGERKLGHIVDISLGGLAFCYIHTADRTIESVHLGIVFGNDGEYLDRLPHRVVYDQVISKDTSFHPIMLRRRSIQFLDLTTNQKDKLQNFINKHALITPRTLK